MGLQIVVNSIKKMIFIDSTLSSSPKQIFHLKCSSENSVFGIPWLRTIFILAFIGIQGEQGREVDKIFYNITPAENGRFTLLAKIMPPPERDSALIQPNHDSDQYTGPGAKVLKQRKVEKQEHQIQNGQTDKLVFRRASVE